jgi:hypothetical protein
MKIITFSKSLGRAIDSEAVEKLIYEKIALRVKRIFRKKYLQNYRDFNFLPPRHLSASILPPYAKP